MKRLMLCAALAACTKGPPTDGPVDAGPDDDPLTSIDDTPAPGSLDDLHQKVIAKRCSGQPGLCHNGQFEPNLSTPAMTYAYLVERPALENITELRVKPGDSAHSLLIDKLRNRNGVSTQMPLGAEPLAEADIAAIEAWIDAGALREPGAAPAPVLNNPPKRPQIGIFAADGHTRLDGTGPMTVNAPAQLVIRHSVQDFETPDASIPFAAVIVTIADGRQLVLNPGNPSDPGLGVTAFDGASPPMGNGDSLDFQIAVNVPATLDLVDPNTKAPSQAPAAGQTLNVLALYLDDATPNVGIAAFDISPTKIEVQ